VGAWVASFIGRGGGRGGGSSASFRTVSSSASSCSASLGSAGITVNVIAPGSILTEGTKKLFYGEDGTFKESVQQLLAHIPLGRPGTPEEVAHAVLFLAASESSYVNGAVLTVDGGWTAGYAREF